MRPLTIRRLSFAFALAVFATASLFHPLKPAYSCSCVAPRPPLEARDAAQAVFSGTASSVQSDANGLLITFDVDEIWSGGALRRAPACAGVAGRVGAGRRATAGPAAVGSPAGCWQQRRP